LVFQSRIDSIVSSTERMKQAEHCGCSSKPDVEPDGRVERRHLVQEDVRQLGLEGVAVLDGGEVAPLAPPVGDRAGDAADHLLDRVLARGRAELAAEVLLGDDVRRVLRPRLRELDAGLLEREPVAVPDARVAALPLDRVVRVHARSREQPPDRQGLTGGGLLDECGLWGGCHLGSPLVCPGDASSSLGGHDRGAGRGD
jgi:hypothetical protein